MACPEGKPLRAAPWCSRRVKCSQHAEPYRLWTASRVGPAANAIPWHMIPSGMTFLRPVCMLGGDCFGLAGPAMTESEPMADTPLPAEFALIARHFRPLAGPGALGLATTPPCSRRRPGRELVLTVDAMIGGVHFLPDDPPDLVGRKLLRVNLSDLAAKGATPIGYLMTVAAPRDTPDAGSPASPPASRRTSANSTSRLLGGDTTSTPGPVALSLTIIGHVAPGTMVRRAGAQPGDGIWVTGTIGDGALGLAVATGKTGRPHRPPASPLPSAAAARRPGDRRRRLRRHGCLRRAGAGPRPSLPRRRPGRRDRRRPAAAVRRRRGRPAPTGCPPS